jgi:L-fuculose-phosphate aldolase
MAYKGTTGKTISTTIDWKLKEQFCDIGRRIWQRGFCAGNEGNHSFRLSEDRILCTPTGISKGNLKPSDLCVVDMTGKQISGTRKRTSEILMHLAIYKIRDDVKAVIHSHPPHATAFAVAGVDLPTCIHPEAEVFLGPVHTAKYVTPGDTRLGESIAPFVKDSNTVLMGNHGVVCYGHDLENAYYKLEIVDAYSRILILAKQVGSIKTLSMPEMKELVALKARFGMSDPRTNPDGSVMDFTCSTDFLARVGGDIATRGRMASPTGGTCSVPQSSGLERAIASMVPEKIDDNELEQLVQTITDQIMATA